jgi:hypothetical protein
MNAPEVTEIKAMIDDAERQKVEAQAAYLRLDGAIQALRLVLEKFGAGEQPAPKQEAQ